MSLAAHFRSHTGIGLDVNRRYIHAAQLVCERGGWTLAHAATFRRPEPNDEIEAAELRRIAQALNRQGFRGRNVRIALPQQHVISTMVEGPTGNAVVQSDIARIELAAISKSELDSLEVATWPTRNDTHESESVAVMAVGCKSAHAHAVLDTFEKAGLVVTNLDLCGPALARAAACSARNPAWSGAVVNLDWGHAHLLCVRNGVIGFERRLVESGLDVVHGALRRELGIRDEAADHLMFNAETTETGASGALAKSRAVYLRDLVKELHRSLDYVGREWAELAPNEIVLTGPGADTPGLTDELAQRLAVPAAAFSFAAPASVETVGSHRLGLAIGLALSSEEVVS